MLITWARIWGAHIIAACTQITIIIVHFEDIIDRFTGWFGIKKIIERRNQHMSIFTEVEAFLSIIPELEKVVSDAKATAADPNTQKLVADVEAIIAKAKASAGTAKVPITQSAPQESGN